MRTTPTLRSAVVIASVLAGGAGSALAQGYQWINPDGGDWEWTPNWSRPTYPSTLANNVYIAEPGAYTVLASTPLAARSLHIPNPDALVVFGPGSSLTLGTGPFPIDGTLEFRNLGTTGSSQPALLFTADSELSGSGELLVTNDVPQRLTRIDAERTITIAEGFTVRGSFDLRARTHNHGTVIGQSDAGTAPKVRGPLSQGPTGQLISDGVPVRLDGELSGGTLAAVNGGRFEVHAVGADGWLWLQNTRIDAPLTIFDGAIVEIDQPCENNSDIIVHFGNVFGVGPARLRIGSGQRLDGSGSITLNADLPTNSAELECGSSIEPGTLGPDQHVRGSGVIRGHLNLESSITADRPGEELMLNGVTVISSGRVGANSGDLVFIDATVTGGEIFTDGGGRVITAPSRSMTLRDVRITGLIESGSIDLEGSCVNDGVISVSGSADSESLLGDGEVLLTSAAARLVVGLLDAGQTVRGHGTVRVGSIARGDFVAGTPGATLRVECHAGAWIESARLRAEEGVIGLGAVSARNTAFATHGGGRVDILDGVNRLENASFEPGLRVAAAGGTFDLSGVTTVEDGVSFVATSAHPLSVSFAPGSTVAASGDFLLDAGSRPRDLELVAVGQQPLVVPETARLEGSARLSGPFEVQGVIAPRGAVPVIEHVMGTLRLAETATLDLAMGPEGSSKLRGQADFIELGGALVVRHDSPQDIRAGDAWELITAQEISGAFASVALPGVPPALRLDLDVADRSVTLRAWCAADFSQNGSVDFHDLSMFLNLFAQQAAGADLAAPFGVWNFHDVSAFLALFNAECPERQ